MNCVCLLHPRESDETGDHWSLNCMCQIGEMQCIYGVSTLRHSSSGVDGGIIPFQQPIILSDNTSMPPVL